MLLRTKLPVALYMAALPRVEAAPTATRLRATPLAAFGIGTIAGVIVLSMLVANLARWLLAKGEPIWLIAAAPFALGLGIVIAAAWLGLQSWRERGVLLDMRALQPLSAPRSRA